MGLVEAATQHLTAANVALAFACGVIYVFSLYIYRAYFDSLSHIPGPKLAAATLWYEFYYDVVKMGRYTWKIGELHEKYGMQPPGTSVNLSNPSGPLIDLSDVQAQLSASAPTKSISMIPNSSTKSTRAQLSERRNIRGQCECLASNMRFWSPRITSSIEFDEECLHITSPKLP